MARRWRCGICGHEDRSEDPRRALEDHYYTHHHEEAPF